MLWISQEGERPQLNSTQRLKLQKDKGIKQQHQLLARLFLASYRNTKMLTSLTLCGMQRCRSVVVSTLVILKENLQRKAKKRLSLVTLSPVSALCAEELSVKFKNSRAIPLNILGVNILGVEGNIGD